jgi:thymidylate synthase
MYQRSCDSLLGIPFNIASYAALLMHACSFAKLTPGVFTHQMGDCHIYCGNPAQGKWYKENLSELQMKIRGVSDRKDYLEIKKWIETDGPEFPSNPKDNLDHVTGALEQLSRDPLKYPYPVLEIYPHQGTATEILDRVDGADFILKGYTGYHYPAIPRKMPA